MVPASVTRSMAVPAPITRLAAIASTTSFAAGDTPSTSSYSPTANTSAAPATTAQTSAARPGGAPTCVAAIVIVRQAPPRSNHHRHAPERRARGAGRASSGRLAGSPRRVPRPLLSRTAGVRISASAADAEDDRDDHYHQRPRYAARSRR